MAELIVYFSRAGENYFSGALRSVPVGNTQRAAELLSGLTGADLFPLEPVQPYADSYNECIAQAQDDLRRDARPELVRWPEDLDRYDTIYLGYPIYWGTIPMPVATFLERSDLSGKTIRPFCTHEGSGLARSVADIRRLCPDATVGTGLAIQGGRVSQAGQALKAWAERK